MAFKQHTSHHFSWRRFVVAPLGVFLLILAGIAWALSLGHVIETVWALLFSIGFTVFTAATGFLTVLFPASSPALDKNLESVHIQYVSELSPKQFKLGDDTAATFPYMSMPIHDAYDLAQHTLQNAAHSGWHGLLILGEACTGKTRLAFEILHQTLSNWQIVCWSSAYQMSDLPARSVLQGGNIVLFIDDLQNYVSQDVEGQDRGKSFVLQDNRALTLQALMERLREKAQHVIVVATCRTEGELAVRAEFSRLFDELQVIRLPCFNADPTAAESAQIISLFQQHGAVHDQDWDGTLGSLVLGLNTKKSQYLGIREKPAAILLRAMKLLTQAGTLDHTYQRIQGVCAGVFGEKSLQKSLRMWDAALNQLIALGFVREDESNSQGSLIIRTDAYYEQVIIDYLVPDRPHQFEDHSRRLQEVFLAQRDAQGLINLGKVYEDSRQYDRALAIYEQALVLEPDLPIGWSHKGNILFKTKRFAEALASYNHALLLEPGLAIVWVNKTVVLGKLKRYEEALAACEQVLILAPNLAISWSYKGGVLNLLRRYHDSLSACEQALLLDPNRVDAWIHKAAALIGLRRFEEALVACDRALQLEPGMTEAWTNKASALSHLLRYKEVLEACEQGLKLDPEDAAAWSNKAGALIHVERYSEALASCEQALAFDSSHAETWVTKGTALYLLDRSDEALQACDRAFQIDSNFFDAWVGRGMVLLGQKRYEEAFVAFERVIALDPLYGPGWANKGTILVELERYEEALEAWEHAMQLAPISVEDWIYKEKLLFHLGRYELAILAADQAIQLDPSHAEAWLVKGIVFQVLGRSLEAMLAYRQAGILAVQQIVSLLMRRIQQGSVETK